VFLYQVLDAIFTRWKTSTPTVQPTLNPRRTSVMSDMVISSARTTGLLHVHGPAVLEVCPDSELPSDHHSHKYKQLEEGEPGALHLGTWSGKIETEKNISQTQLLPCSGFIEELDPVVSNSVPSAAMFVRCGRWCWENHDQTVLFGNTSGAFMRRAAGRTASYSWKWWKAVSDDIVYVNRSVLFDEHTSHHNVASQTEPSRVEHE
jgi:hypothetical protein